MKKMRTFLIVSSLLLFSCKKEVSELPPVTDTGTNSFGCMVNGEYWVPEGFGIVPTAPLLEARYIDRNIVINARKFSSFPTETEFEFYLKNVITPGTYLLNENTDIYPNLSASYAYYVKRRLTPEDEWITNAQFTGRVNVTKTDTVNKIISGTFEFQAQSLYNPEQSISVTEGRFDIKIQ